MCTQCFLFDLSPLGASMNSEIGAFTKVHQVKEEECYDELTLFACFLCLEIEELRGSQLKNGKLLSK